ncbi:MAG: hypothetical protein ACRD1Y_11975 [Terriglobales bacterium]
MLLAMGQETDAGEFDAPRVAGRSREHWPFVVMLMEPAASDHACAPDCPCWGAE